MNKVIVVRTTLSIHYDLLDQSVELTSTSGIDGISVKLSKIGNEPNEETDIEMEDFKDLRAIMSHFTKECNKVIKDDKTK